MLEYLEWTSFVYAVGDIHGCLQLLQDLERQIALDCAAHGQPAKVVLLGDYVDRGPDAAGVLDYIMVSPEAPFERICLMGNHELMMLDFFAAPRENHSWLHHGGNETLSSYGLNPATLFDGGKRMAAQRLLSHVPDEHLLFLKQLPLSLKLPDMVFVHAGLRPGLELNRHGADDLLWMRPVFGNYQQPQPDGMIVHGHTIGDAPVIEPYRICLDTGAYASGTLSAMRRAPSADISFLFARSTMSVQT